MPRGRRNPSTRHLTLKHSVWWFRRAIPADCQSVLGGDSALMTNLHTGNLKTAQQARIALVRETDEVFAAIRDGSYGKDGRPKPQEIGQLFRAALVEAQDADADEEVALIRSVAEDMAERQLSQRDRSAFTTGWIGAEDITAHLDVYISGAGLTERTERERRAQVQRFADWCAGRSSKITLDRVTRRVAGDYVSEVIDAMQSPATQRKHLTGLRQYWVFLAKRGLITLPQGAVEDQGWPWAGQQRTAPKGRRAVRGIQKAEERAFTADEIRALLTGQPEGRMNASHVDQCRKALCISLLTGMRLAEVVTLWAEDVERDEDGLWISIKEGKTEAAARRVPVHSSLVSLIEAMTKGKGRGEWLFHDLKAERDPGDVFSKRFARFRQRLGVDEKLDGVRRSLVNFHSARRWFITSARHADQPKETIQEVVGHAVDDGDVTFGIYTQGASKAQLRACVEAVKLPEETK